MKGVDEEWLMKGRLVHAGIKGWETPKRSNGSGFKRGFDKKKRMERVMAYEYYGSEKCSKRNRF